jgi:hypothetical protein
MYFKLCFNYLLELNLFLLKNHLDMMDIRHYWVRRNVFLIKKAHREASR